MVLGTFHARYIMYTVLPKGLKRAWKGWEGGDLSDGLLTGSWGEITFYPCKVQAKHSAFYIRYSS